MGLDMYLKKMPKVEQYTFEEMIAFRNQAYENESGLPKEIREAIVVEHTYGMKQRTLAVEIGYWRKANHIHNWFVEHVQGGEDECDAHEVTREHVESLLGVVTKVLALRSSSVAEASLPTSDGFFFGSTEYDEFYFDSLGETKEILEKTLETTDFDQEYVFYLSSW